MRWRKMGHPARATRTDGPSQSSRRRCASIASPAEASVPVRMMHVGHVRMPVPQPDMLVAVGMRLPRRTIGTVHVPVLNVVHVAMNMRHRFMVTVVVVHFRQVEPDAGTHQQPRDQRLKRVRRSSERSDGATPRHVRTSQRDHSSCEDSAANGFENKPTSCGAHQFARMRTQLRVPLWNDMRLSVS